jgi:hypothetical protein
MRIRFPSSALVFSMSLGDLPPGEVQVLVSALRDISLPERHEPKNEWLSLSKQGDGVLASPNWNFKLYSGKYGYSSIVCADFPTLAEFVHGVREDNIRKFAHLSPVMIDDAGIGFPLGGAMVGVLVEETLHTALTPTEAFANDVPRDYASQHYGTVAVELLTRLKISSDTHRIIICPGSINCPLRDRLRGRGFRVDIGKIEGDLQDGLEQRFAKYILEELGYEGYFDPKDIMKHKIPDKYADAVRWGWEHGHLKTMFKGLSEYKGDGPTSGSKQSQSGQGRGRRSPQEPRRSGRRVRT